MAEPSQAPVAEAVSDAAALGAGFPATAPTKPELASTPRWTPPKPLAGLPTRSTPIVSIPENAPAAADAGNAEAGGHLAILERNTVYLQRADQHRGEDRDGTDGEQGCDLARIEIPAEHGREADQAKCGRNGEQQKRTFHSDELDPVDRIALAWCAQEPFRHGEAAAGIKDRPAHDDASRS